MEVCRCAGLEHGEDGEWSLLNLGYEINYQLCIVASNASSYRCFQSLVHLAMCLGDWITQKMEQLPREPFELFTILLWALWTARKGKWLYLKLCAGLLGCWFLINIEHFVLIKNIKFWFTYHIVHRSFCYITNNEWNLGIFVISWAVKIFLLLCTTCLMIFVV